MTARVIHAKFRRTRSIRLRKVLIMKLYSEYTASFELLAALCLALRQRKARDFLETMSTYAPGDVQRFYESIRLDAGSFNIMSYAALPALAEVRQRTSDPVVLHAYEYSSVALSRRVRQAADQLGGTNFLTIHIHNKVKHGCLFVDDPEVLRDYYSYGADWEIGHNDSRVYVAAKLKADSSGRRRMVQPPAILDATGEFARKLLNNTYQLCRSAREITAMSIEMNRLGLLW